MRSLLWFHRWLCASSKVVIFFGQTSPSTESVPERERLLCVRTTKAVCSRGPHPPSPGVETYLSCGPRLFGADRMPFRRFPGSPAGDSLILCRMARDNFPQTTIKKLRARTGYHCSNPDCGVVSVAGWLAS